MNVLKLYPKSILQRFNLSSVKIILNSRSVSNYYISTPIFYVNGSPHIGHMYTSVLADAISRWQTLKGTPVLFSTGYIIILL